MATSSLSETAAASTAAATASKAQAAQSKFAESFDTFLVMLTTQLKHQDPLSPMDSSEFTNQLVQFASVEQQINANTNLESLIAIQQTNQTASAIGYMGQTIEIGSDQIPLQDGKSAFSLTLDAETRSTVVQITDSAGKVIRNITAPTTSGRHEMTWDGKDDNGVQQEDGGKYYVQVMGTGYDGAEVSAVVTAYGRVTEVAGSANGTLLGMSGVVSYLDSVLTIRDTASLTNSASN